MQRNSGFERLRIGQHCQPFTEGPVADLVVVLQEEDESGRRKVAAERAPSLAATIGRRLALIDEPFLEAARQTRRGLIGVIGVVALALASQQRVQDVMAVIIPLRIEIAGKEARRIVIVFQHQMDPTT